jgi:hypothetical protein
VRKIKAATTPTIYPNEFYTHFGSGSGNQFKHISIGKERILTKESRIAPDREHWYYHPDHLGSTAMVTNEQSQLVDALIAGSLLAAAPATADTMCTCFTTVALAAAATVYSERPPSVRNRVRVWFWNASESLPLGPYRVQPADR